MKVRVRPGPGLRVRLPAGPGVLSRVLDQDTPIQGVELERDMFVLRALQCGDLVEVETQAAPHQEIIA